VLNGGSSHRDCSTASGEEDQAQMLADLVVGQSGRVPDEMAGEVVLGVGAAAGGEPAQRLHDVGVAGDRGLGALERVPGGLDHPVVVLLGHADDVAHHGHREVLGELAHQLGPAAPAEAVDQALGGPVDVPAHAAVVDGRHGRGDRAAQPLVLVALGVGADGLPRDVRHERVVGLDRALQQRRPDTAVAAVLGGRAHHVHVLGVAEDHPHRYVVVEQHRCHRAVLFAQLLVELVQVLRAGPVEPVQSAGATAVRGAAGRRIEGEVVRTGGHGVIRRHWVAPKGSGKIREGPGVRKGRGSPGGAAVGEVREGVGGRAGFR
jgi:hypothetical protein